MLPGNQVIKHDVDPQNDPGRYKMEIIRKSFYNCKNMCISVNISFSINLVHPNMLALDILPGP